MATPTPKLLPREEFASRVFARDKNRCVVCGYDGPELDAHHLLERDLWGDGGYYLDNGVTLCDTQPLGSGCHYKAEATVLSVEYLRERAGITNVVVPSHLSAETPMDKWGNEILPNGNRLRGEMFFHPSVQRILAPLLHLFTPYVKAPRTWHLPWSPGRTPDDRVLDGVSQFVGREIVVTAKMDGENVTVNHGGYVHARKVEPINTPNSERMKALAAEIGGDIPVDWRVCGESLIRQHTIHYQNLPPGPRWFYQVFNVWDHRNVCLDWDGVCEWAALLDLPTVPVLYRGPWDEKLIRGLLRDTHDGDPMEGYVVRVTDPFPFGDYRRLVGKCVRDKFHMPQNGKWRYAAPVFNAPKSEP